MDDRSDLEASRRAHARHDWAAARRGFLAAQDRAGLAPDDAAGLSDAAWWLGRIEESLVAGEAAYRGYLDEGRPRPAAMAAIFTAVNLFLRGDDAEGSGWMGRAQRLLDGEEEGPEHGYVRYLLGVEAALDGPDLGAVVAAAQEVRAIGERHGDPDLVALATVGEGRALIRQGRAAAGMALLDEAMVAATSGELAPEWAGNVYCHLMAACHELADLARGAAWTDATARWLETLPAAVLFTGICRVHRSQILQAQGAWPQAEREATLVCRDLRHIHRSAAAEGHYQLGELHRLRGDLAAAEAAYACAHDLGHDAQPGLALLRLAQGRPAAAAAAVRTALAASTTPLATFPLSVAQVEIALDTGDLDTAGQACRRLEELATTYASPGIEVAALEARGALALAQGRPEEALADLRQACRRWRSLGAPFDGALAGVRLARACRALGDVDTAGRELDAAAQIFEALGAQAQLQRVRDLREPPAMPGGLTGREVEVLALVAAGHTNRQVADSLTISERTVGRHLSNIFVKLGVSSRTAAAAFAYEHGLVPPAGG
ncbi:MAG TPA: response regulator transcription factor [Acidimicrobiales bacterium]|nr:response regulator transcription factor [Acidimicrobiales bacterium]